MQEYLLRLSPKFDKHLKAFKKAGELKSIKKVEDLLEEIKLHPRTGTGQPEQLKGYREREVWSRHITKKHRLVYEIQEEVVIVLVLSAYGHYDDD